LRTGIVSEPFEVRDGAPPIETTIDLANLAVVRGRIEAPEGTKPGSVFVVVEGVGVDMRTGYGPGRGIQRDGTFEVRFPSGRRVTIRPWHETLKPAAGEAGSVVVDGPRDGIVLRLVEGPKVRVRVLDPSGAPPIPESVAQGTLWFRRQADTPADWTGRDLTMADDGIVSAPAVSIGIVDLWVDVPPYAPRLLARRTLIDGTTELGEVRLDRGSTLILRARSPKGAPLPTLRGMAERIDLPPVSRDVLEPSSAGQPPEIRGLCRGTWKLQLWWKTSKDEERTLEKDVEVDGVGDVTIDVDVD
jgi:hypothetical protein